MTRKEVIDGLKRLVCNDHLYSIIIEVAGVKLPANFIENINGTIYIGNRKGEGDDLQKPEI
jgi:hypothetical protein